MQSLNAYHFCNFVPSHFLNCLFETTFNFHFLSQSTVHVKRSEVWLRFQRKNATVISFKKKEVYIIRIFAIYYRNVLVRHDYVKIRSQRLMGFSISIFVKRKHLLHVRDVEAQYTRLSVMESVSFNASLEYLIRFLFKFFYYFPFHSTRK